MPDWEAKDEIRGIRGWLLLPLVHLVATPMYLVWMVVHRLPDIATRVPQHPQGAQVAFVILLAPYFAFVIWCLVRFLQERRGVPWLMTVFYGLNIALVFAYLLGPAAADASTFGNKLSLLIQIAMSAALIAYFHNSVRVKNTFFRTAPPRAAKPPAAAAGIGGWLVPTFALLVFWTGAAVYGLVAGHIAAKMLFAVQHGHWLALLKDCGLLAFVAASVVCIAGFVRRKRYVPMLMAGLLAVLIVVSVAAGNWHAHFRGGVVILALLAAIMGYVLRSQRVKNTFVR